MFKAETQLNVQNAAIAIGIHGLFPLLFRLSPLLVVARETRFAS